MKKEKYSLIFSVAQLEKGPMVLAGEFPPEFLKLTENELFEVTSPVSYRLEAMLVTGNVLVRGRISCTVKGECGRCLCPVEKTVEVADIEIFEDEITEDEVDVTEDVRTEMVLTLPINLLCSEDCAGLCPVCGVNLNTAACSCRTEEKASDAGADGASPWGALDNIKL